MTNYDAIVIGAGIAGAAAAYYLTRQRLNVAIVERDAPAAHASGFAFGMVSAPFQLHNDAHPSERLLKRSVDLHHQLPQELPEASAEPYHAILKAGIRLALTDAEASELSRIGIAGFAAAAANIPHRQDVRWLDYGALSHIEARISNRIPGGLYIGGQLEVSPAGVTNALVNAALASGNASLITTTATQIAIERGAVTGIDTTDGRLSAPNVVLAAGPWCAHLLAQSPGAEHIALPVEPLKGQIIRFDIGNEIPMPVTLWWSDDYAATKPDGMLYAGTTEEPVGFDVDTTDEAAQAIRKSATTVLPFLADANIAQQTACLRPIAPDRIPVVGTLDSIRGMVIATGGGRSGIEYGPGIGELAAQFVSGAAHSVAPPSDFTALSPNRFAT